MRKEEQKREETESREADLLLKYVRPIFFFFFSLSRSSFFCSIQKSSGKGKFTPQLPSFYHQMFLLFFCLVFFPQPPSGLSDVNSGLKRTKKSETQKRGLTCSIVPQRQHGDPTGKRREREKRERERREREGERKRERGGKKKKKNDISPDNYIKELLVNWQ